MQTISNYGIRLFLFFSFPNPFFKYLVGARAFWVARNQTRVPFWVSCAARKAGGRDFRLQTIAWEFRAWKKPLWPSRGLLCFDFNLRSVTHRLYGCPAAFSSSSPSCFLCLRMCRTTALDAVGASDIYCTDFLLPHRRRVLHSTCVGSAVNQRT